MFEYPDAAGPGKAKQLIFEQRIWSPYVQEGYENGAAFYGTDGVLIIGHSVGWTLYGPRNKKIAERKGSADLPAHHQNFLDCVRGQQDKPNADVTAGHRAATLVHLANIAARTGRVLHFDRPSRADHRRSRSRGDDHAPLSRGSLGGAQGRLMLSMLLISHAFRSRASGCSARSVKGSGTGPPWTCEA